jgi:ribosomal protein S18 acetylase RimI-like enzyme
VAYQPPPFAESRRSEIVKDAAQLRQERLGLGTVEQRDPIKSAREAYTPAPAMKTTPRTGSVIPWRELPDLASIAALLGRARDDLAAELAGMPAGIEGVALVESGVPVAAGLWITADLARRGQCTLAWVSAAASRLDAALQLVTFAETRAVGLGAQRLEVAEKAVGGIAPHLEARGYAPSDAMLRLERRSRRDVLPLPPGVAERSLGDVGLDAWAALSNEAFSEVAFNVPVARDDLKRLTAEPTFDGRLVRFAADEAGLLAFLHATLDRGGRGEVLSIGVARRGRGRGLGRWALRRAEQFLDDAGACEVTLRVASSNRTARSLYEREGYAERSRTQAWQRALGSPGQSRR